MKVIIAGSRTITDFKLVESAIKYADWLINEVISGGAAGVDSLGEVWAHRNKVPVKRFQADWNKRDAGKVRNLQMARYADALIAVWDGRSTGTEHMINTADALGLKVFVMISNAQTKRHIWRNKTPVQHLKG